MKLFQFSLKAPCIHEVFCVAETLEDAIEHVKKNYLDFKLKDYTIDFHDIENGLVFAISE